MPRSPVIPRTALGALLIERMGARHVRDVAPEIGVGYASVYRWMGGGAPDGAAAALAAWLQIEEEEVRRLAATPHEAPGDPLGQAARAKRGRRPVAEVAHELGIGMGPYRRVELGKSVTESTRAAVAAWVSA